MDTYCCKQIVLMDLAWPKSENEFIDQVLKGTDGKELIHKLAEVCYQIESIERGFVWPQNETEFAEWFWTENNGTDILTKLQTACERQQSLWPKNKSAFLNWFWENDNGQELLRKVQEVTAETETNRHDDIWPRSEYEFVSTWFWKKDNLQKIMLKLHETSNTNHRYTKLLSNAEIDVMALMLTELKEQFRNICDGIEKVCRDQFWPKNKEEFLVWFWYGNNGDDLIRKLNDVPGQNNRIRREKIIPKIYAVYIDNKWFEQNGKKWKLCKVGSTGQEDSRRASLLKEQIRTGTYFKGPAPTPHTLFELPVSACDASPLIETEGKIRNQVGESFQKSLAKEINLPSHTEWVCTTQDHIELIQAKIQEWGNKNGDVIDLFDKNVLPKPPEVPIEVKLLFQQEVKKFPL